MWKAYRGKAKNSQFLWVRGFRATWQPHDIHVWLCCSAIASEDLAALELLESAAQTLPAPGYQSSLHTLHFPDSGQPTGQLVDVPRWDPVEMPSASQNQAASLATAPGRALHAEPTLPEHVSQMTIQEFLNCSPSAQERARRESTILGWMPPGAPLPLPAPPSELTGSYHANSNAPRLSHSGPPNPLYASEQAGLASALPPQQLGTWPTGGGQAATTGYAAADLNTAQYMQVSAERQETPVRQVENTKLFNESSGQSCCTCQCAVCLPCVCVCACVCTYVCVCVHVCVCLFLSLFLKISWKS